MNKKLKRSISYLSLFILALAMLPLGNLLASEKVEPTKFVIEENNLEANGFKIANDQVLTNEDVVKLSNVKSVDNLVDVNTLTVSADQLAIVNQSNPGGGLYYLTMTNEQLVNITIPVVKEGSLTTTNNKGALIIANASLSEHANNEADVLAETEAYSIAFNNGFINHDLAIKVTDKKVSIKDTNLGLCRELINPQPTTNAANNTNEQEADTKSPDVSSVQANEQPTQRAVQEEFTIKYFPNPGQGGTPTVPPTPHLQTAIVGEEVVLDDSPFTREGYDFMGWADKPKGAVKYQNADNVLFDAMEGDTVNLYAVWKPHTFTITFVGGDGTTGNTPQQVFKWDIAQPLNMNEFEKPGYHFLGWTTIEGSEDVEYFDEQTISNFSPVEGANFTLYAIWEANQYRIQFDKNPGQGSTPVVGEVPPIKKTYDQQQSLPADKFSREGYEFAGWSTKPEGPVQYQPNDVLTQDLTTTTRKQTLYAIWTPHTYTIKFDANSGVGQMPDVTATFDQAADIPNCAFTKAGYAFAGWQVDGSDQIIQPGANGLNLTSTQDGVVILKATWSANQYQIQFDKNPGQGSSTVTGNVANINKTYDTPVQLPTETYSRDGYTFKGWAKTADAKVADFEAGSTLSEDLTTTTDTQTLYAVWEANTYTVNFNGGDGAKGQMQPQTLTFDQGPTALTANAFTKDGYTFKGWSTQEGGSVVDYTDMQEVNNLTTQNQGVVELYAVWEANTYTVTFVKGDGAQGDMADQAFTYDQAQSLTANAFSKEGYTFKGWSTQEGATTPEYTDQQEVKNLTTTLNGNVKLYAVWEANTYTVTFKPNKGNGSTDVTPNTDYTQTFTYGAGPVALTKNQFSRPGYTFKGWSDVADPQDASYVDGEEVENLTAVANGNIDLYAIWAPNKYTISFDANGGEGQPMNPLAAIFDQPTTIPESTFTKPGNTFSGWKVQGTDTIIQPGASVTDLSTEANGNVVLVAQWQENPAYTITYKANGGEGNDVVTTQPLGSIIQAQQNTFTRGGFEFVGWAKDPNGPATIQPGDDISNLFTQNGELFAVWKQLDQTTGPNGEGITPDKRGWVNAQDTTVHSSQAIADITSVEALIPAMNAQAEYDGIALTPSVSAADLAKIQAGIVGSYPVVFMVTGPQTRALGPNQAQVTRIYTIIEDEQPTPAPATQPNQIPVASVPTPTGVGVNLTTALVVVIASFLLILVRRNRK